MDNMGQFFWNKVNKLVTYSNESVKLFKEYESSLCLQTIWITRYCISSSTCLAISWESVPSSYPKKTLEVKGTPFTSSLEASFFAFFRGYFNSSLNLSDPYAMNCIILIFIMIFWFYLVTPCFWWLWKDLPNQNAYLKEAIRFFHYICWYFIWFNRKSNAYLFFGCF